MRLTLNPLLIPGIILLKVQGKVLKAIIWGEAIPSEVDEIALCLEDYEELQRLVEEQNDGVDWHTSEVQAGYAWLHPGVFE